MSFLSPSPRSWFVLLRSCRYKRRFCQEAGVLFGKGSLFFSYLLFIPVKGVADPGGGGVAAFTRPARGEGDGDAAQENIGERGGVFVARGVDGFGYDVRSVRADRLAHHVI